MYLNTDNRGPKDSLSLGLEALTERRIHAAIGHLTDARLTGSALQERCGHLWHCYMLLGLFEEAWKQSDALAELTPEPPDPLLLWDRKPLDERRVIIRCLHGYGDAIQFVRYSAAVRQLAAHTIVQTHAELIPLFRAASLADAVIGWQQEDRAAWDVQVEVMELPRIFRTTESTIPAQIPYLRVPAAYRRRSRVPPSRGPAPRIGLQWQSSQWDLSRSIELAELAPLFQRIPCELFRFQRGCAPDDENCAGLPPMLDVSGDSPDILHAAADLLNIDLLITVDTMLAHLAGALGTRVWVLLPFEADWRWMLNRRDSPWYPTMRLFRQPARGDWHSAVQLMKQELEDCVAHLSQEPRPQTREDPSHL